VAERAVPAGEGSTGEGSAGEVTRRRLLRLGVAGMVGLGAAGCGDVDAAREGGLAFAQRTLLPRPVPAVVTPKPVRPRTAPVHTLQDYAAKVPKNAVALTVDDGPSPRWTPMVLDVLRRYRVQATFCLIGQHVRQRPQLARRIVEEGHSVCNHTMSHPRGLGSLRASQIDDEIAETNAAIAEATGQTPRVFRSPGGEWGPAIFAAAARHGLVPIDWSVDPMDWKKPGVQTIATRMLAATPGQILLCHDGGGNRAQTVAALNTVIPALQQRGLRFVAL
jgi:peptidoglycan-N-acetylglucosamine deacetylase